MEITLEFFACFLFGFVSHRLWCVLERRKEKQCRRSKMSNSTKIGLETVLSSIRMILSGLVASSDQKFS